MNPTSLNRFEINPVSIDISRSLFNRNHSVKFSFNMGQVIPFYTTEVMPGDTFSIDTTKVVRVQPLVTPIMDNIVLDTYYFFIPYRLVWNHWINFMGENTASAWTPSVEYTVPQLTIPSSGFNVHTIADYLGVPPNAGGGLTINALPFRCYALTCDQWFRSEALQNPVHVTVDDTTITGVNTSDQVTDIEKGGMPFIACKLPDYFTMALPQPQSGPDVTFGLGGLAPVNAYANKFSVDVGDSNTNAYGSLASMHALGLDTNTNKFTSPTAGTLGMSSSGNIQHSTSTQSLTDYAIVNNLWADVGQVSAVSVNELRMAFAIQRYYEKLARGGRRYIEQIQAFYNVKSPDARLQRVEYLGGNRMPINVTQVEQTSATNAVTPQGNVTGLSLTGDDHSDFTKSFTEHGMILGVVVARFQHTYQQGLDRMFTRKTIFDYYNPTFANIGEQPIRRSEIYFTNSLSNNNAVFGYQEAWADYRYKPNRVAGEMRSVYATPLDMWHLADNYTSVPYLGSSWIQEDIRTLDRCLAVSSQVANQFLADIYIQEDVSRPMPMYSIPGLIDHH